MTSHKHTLAVQERTVVGRKVKQLRKKGNIPATVYGKSIPSQSIAVSADAFGKAYKEAGESSLVELTLEGAIRPVLIHSVQRDPLTDAPIHVEFYQVNLKEKVRTKVPVLVSGESPAVAQKLGVLLTVLNDVEVEALPGDLPEHVAADVSGLSQVDQEFKVLDLVLPHGVTMLTSPDLTVVKVGALVSKEAEAEAAAEAAVVTAAAEEAKPSAEAVPQEVPPEEAKQ